MWVENAEVRKLKYDNMKARIKRSYLLYCCMPLLTHDCDTVLRHISQRVTVSQQFEVKPRDLGLQQPLLTWLGYGVRVSGPCMLQTLMWLWYGCESCRGSLLRILTRNCQAALDSGDEVCSVFFDLCKAFDKVPHLPLLQKLAELQVNPCILRWIGSYSLNRLQAVVLGVSNLALYMSYLVSPKVLFLALCSS